MSNAKKVLIIDDSPTQLNSLKIFFKREGFEVETASDGLQGYVKVYKNTPDVIVSDVLMPYLSGFQLCRLLKRNKDTKNIPFIMLTVLDKNLDKFWGSQCGADLFLKKDSSVDIITSHALEFTKTMPVSEEIKHELSINEVDEDGIITQINKILDEELMKTTITNKFREITDYIREDEFVANKIFNIISSIIDYDVACLSFSTPYSASGRKLIFDEQNVSVTQKFMQSIWYELFPEAGDPCMVGVTKKEKNENAHTINEKEDLKSKLEFVFYCDNVEISKLCFYSREEIQWENIDFIDIVKSELDVVLRLKYLYAKTQHLSITDELTQLYTRRHMNGVILQEFERARRYGTILTVAMIDIDDFKKINDKYGHLAGDFVLKEIASIFLNTLRKTDYIYRYGGEELCVLMPETVIEKAYTPLERLRKAIEVKEFIFDNQKIPVTISIGTATYKKEMGHWRDLVECADNALYQAKRTGKNKVVISEDE